MVPVSYSLLTDANGEASFSRYFLAIPPPLDGHPFDLAPSLPLDGARLERGGGSDITSVLEI